MSTGHHEVAVVGLGALGAATLWQLAVRGVDAVGVDQFAPPHPYGGTHGQTRLFRRACLEHPDLFSWATRSAELFDELGTARGTALLQRTGGVVIGLPDAEGVSGTRAAIEQNGGTAEMLDADELRVRFPQHADIRDAEVGVIDPDAGYADPEGFVASALAAAADAGAAVIGGTRVVSIERGRSGVAVRTALGDVHAEQVVVAAGAWLGSLVPGLPLDPIRTPMTWFSPRPGALPHDLGGLGVFVREIDADTMLWGHGHLPGGLLKIGLADTHERTRQRIDPDRFDRGTTPSDSAETIAAVARWLSGIEPVPARIDPCMITRTPDDQFVVGRWDERTLVAGGDSGHAFKHAPAIGELLAQTVLGERVGLPTAFVDPHRFDGV